MDEVFGMGLPLIRDVTRPYMKKVGAHTKMLRLTQMKHIYEWYQLIAVGLENAQKVPLILRNHVKMFFLFQLVDAEHKSVHDSTDDFRGEFTQQISDEMQQKVGPKTLLHHVLTFTCVK